MSAEKFMPAAAPIDLRAGDVGLWLTYYDEITDAQLHNRYLLLLNPVEREQRKRFHLPRDRLRYLVTRALVRTVLSRYLPLDEAAWIFAANAYGRPHIANPGVLASDFRFNISHTHGLIALAVARGREVGVDVENTRAHAIDTELADDADRWQFWQFRPAADYLVAVCAERIPAQPARLLVRKIVPGAAEHALATALTRTSESTGAAEFGEAVELGAVE